MEIAHATVSAGWHVVGTEWEPRINVSNSGILAARSAWSAAHGGDTPS